MTTPDFSQMSPEQFAAWHADQDGPVTIPAPPVTSHGSAHLDSDQSDAKHPSPAPTPQVRPAAEVWGQDGSYDFVTPSGAQCRLHKIVPEKLIENGLLDKMSRLPGFAQEAIDKAQGLPPEKPVDQLEQMKSVLEVLQDLLPMVVLVPKIYRDPADDADKVAGNIYVSSISLEDRLAIMNEVTAGVTRFDNFREDS